MRQAAESAGELPEGKKKVSTLHKKYVKQKQTTFSSFFVWYSEMLKTALNILLPASGQQIIQSILSQIKSDFCCL